MILNMARSNRCGLEEVLLHHALRAGKRAVIVGEQHHSGITPPPARPLKERREGTAPSAFRHTLTEREGAGHVGERGIGLFAEAERLGLEGIVGKRADSAYTAGRSRNWLKVKTAEGKAREALRFDRQTSQ
jgi:hypothetical protein